MPGQGTTAAAPAAATTDTALAGAQAETAAAEERAAAAEREKLKHQKDQLTQFSEAEEQRRTAEFTSFAEGLAQKAVLTPPEKALAVAAMQVLDACAPVEFSEGNTTRKESVLDWFKRRLQAATPAVQFGEHAPGNAGDTVAIDAKTATDEAFDRAVRQHMRAHAITSYASSGCCSRFVHGLSAATIYQQGPINMMTLEQIRLKQNPVLTSILLGMGQGSFVAEFLSRDCQALRGATIASMGNEKQRRYNLRRAPGSNTKRIEVKWEGNVYVVDQHSVEVPIPRELIQEQQAAQGMNVAANLDISTVAMATANDVLLLDYEIEAAEFAARPATTPAATCWRCPVAPSGAPPPVRR